MFNVMEHAQAMNHRILYPHYNCSKESEYLSIRRLIYI